MLQVIGIVILIMLFMFTLQVMSVRRIENCMLKGFWKGSPSFVKDAELDLFLIYIGGGGMLSSKRAGYILMKNDSGLIINNPVEFSFSSGGSLRPGMCPCREYNISIDWLGEEPSGCFPSEQELYYYPESGKLVFAQEELVYGVFYKDHTITDVDELMPEAIEKIEHEGGENI
jgi:hypothetical protein